MPTKLPWSNSTANNWWIDKLLAPLLLVLMTGTATLIVTPQILYLRDKRLAADGLKRDLVEETAAQNTVFTNAAWVKEDALDAALEDALEKQIAELIIAASKVCKHELASPPPIAQLRQSPVGWSGQAVSYYHDQFRAHQLWATRARLGLRHVFQRADIRAAFDKLEQTLGAYDSILEARVTRYNAVLATRDRDLHLLVRDLESKTRSHDDLHEFFSRERQLAVLNDATKGAVTVDSAAASAAESAFFALMRSADVVADAVASDRLRPSSR